jgi:putative copper resistance protein D
MTPADWLLVLARAVHFGSCLVLLGVFAVWLLVVRPAGAAQGRALAGWCVALAAVSGAAWFWAIAAGMSGSGLAQAIDASLLWEVLAHTEPGHVWMLRCGLGIALAALLLLGRGGKSAALLAAALTVSLAWLGHAGAGLGPRGNWLLLADAGHLLAAGVWPGGLAPFGMQLRRRMQRGEVAEARAEVRRFSGMSLVAVPLLAGTGLVNACFLVGSWGALAVTPYGRLLIAKAAVFAIAAGLGARNLLTHKPAMEAEPVALKALARNVWTEAALASVAVAIVAIMGTLPPTG